MFYDSGVYLKESRHFCAPHTLLLSTAESTDASFVTQRYAV